MLPAFMPSVVAFELVEGVAAVLDLLAAGGDAVDDPAPIYELLAERCRHVRVALEVMTGTLDTLYLGGIASSMCT